MLNPTKKNHKGLSIKAIYKKERRGVWSDADKCDQGGGVVKDFADNHIILHVDTCKLSIAKLV